MSERYGDEEIDRLLNAAYCPSMPLKGVVRQLRADLAINVRAIHELQAGAARDREEIVKLREAAKNLLTICVEWLGDLLDDPTEQHFPYAKNIKEALTLLGEGENK